MDEPPPPAEDFYALTARCAAAVARIREAMRQGQTNSEQVDQDIRLIFDNVRPLLVRSARRARTFAPEAEQEALEMMTDQLLRDLLSPTYPSMERAFGAYLKTMRKRVLEKIGRKYSGENVSSLLLRLDAPADDAVSLHETVSDPRAEIAFGNVEVAVMLEDALRQLSPVERFVWRLRWDDVRNSDVAARLDISEVQASRIYLSARAKVRERLGGSKEGVHGGS